MIRIGASYIPPGIVASLVIYNLGHNVSKVYLTISV